MKHRWLFSLGFLIIPVWTAAAADLTGARPTPRKDVAGSNVSCAAQTPHKRCRGSPDSVLMPQVTRGAPARSSAASRANAAAVPQISGRPLRSPLRRRDGEAVPILDAGRCPDWMPPNYECRSAGAGRDLIVRALTESPSAATAGTLEALQIPAFRDVPPIVIIGPDRVPRIGRSLSGPDPLFDSALPLR